MRASLGITTLAVGLVTTWWPARDAAARTWLDGQEAEREFADLARVPAATLPALEPATVPLPTPLRFRGALYDAVIVGEEPGLVRLAWTAGGVEVDPLGLALRPVGGAVRAGDDASVQVRREGALLAVRLGGLEDPAGAPAAVELLVEPGESDSPGHVVVQWLQAPASVAMRAWDVAFTDLGGAGLSRPLLEGLDLRSGAVLVLPGDVAWTEDAEPKAGCSLAQNWCDAVRVRDPGCYTGVGAALTPCSTTRAQRWHFREGQYCRSCPYAFYITVECGTSIHLPFRDMEGNEIRVTDVFTGTQMELEALNDCARTPFRYCDFCATMTGGLEPDPTGVLCPVGPWRDCLPYLQRSTVIQWGWPLFDRDGDTMADDLPCGPPNTDGCSGRQSGAWPAHEEQNTDVVVRGNPALCGVFRVDIVSGGFDWFLSANCTGQVPDDPAEIALQFNIYQNCSDALAAFDPVPELAITRLDFIGVCPNIELEIEVSNLGCVDAAIPPVRLDFSAPAQADLDVDFSAAGAVAAGSSAMRRVPLSLVSAPQTVTATVDPGNLVSECTEQAAGSFSGCAPVTGADTLTQSLCVCVNTVVPGLADDTLVACNGQTVIADASPSQAVPCAGGVTEYQYLDRLGAVLRPWSTDPTHALTPARCPSLEDHSVVVRCSRETGVTCVRSIPFTLECSPAPTLGVTASPTVICEGEPVTLTADAGFGAYAWGDGQTGRVVTYRPTTTSTYVVTGTTASGCSAAGQATVQVLPDPLPGPVGATLRAARERDDVAFTFTELPEAVGSYRLLVHATSGAVSPCAVAAPALPPAPALMDVLPLRAASLPGAASPQLRHVAGILACPRLLFYKVIATSPCLERRGTACNGFPMQLLPCP